MNTLKRKHLIREYVRHALSEQGDLAFAQQMGATGLKGLIEPFTDLAKTALAGVVDIASATYGFAKTLLNVGAMALIPFARVDTDSLRQEHKSRVANFKGKTGMQDVYDRTNKAIGGDDFQMMLFAANPAAYMALNAGKLGTDVMGKNYASFTGKALGTKKENKNHSGILLNEAEQLNPDALAAINNSPAGMELRSWALAEFKNYLVAVNNKAGAVDAIDTIAELES